MKHTPGPWETTGRFVRRGVVVQAKNGKADICDCYVDAEIKHDECDANSRLISASPELLTSCEQMAYALAFLAGGRLRGNDLKMFIDGLNRDDSIIAAARVAIAKAIGASK